MQKRMICFISTMMILFQVTGVFAGEDVCEEKEMRGYLMVGGSSIDLDDLNSRFQGKGYPEISDNLFNIGGGLFRKVAPRVMVGGEGRFFVGGQNSSVVDGSRYSSSVMGGYGLINTAFLVVESDNLDIFPILGMGVGGTNVKLGQSSFDDILNSPYGAASLTSFSFLFNVGLETDFKVKMPGSDNDDSFLFMGVRGGYLFSPAKGGWYSDDMMLSNDPEGGLSGPYVCITFGGGGKIIDKMFDDRSSKKHPGKNVLTACKAAAVPGVLSGLGK